MIDPYFITAIGTPLDEDDRLHEEGLAAELADQRAHGIPGILAAGSMGMMQLLTDETYRALARRSVELFGGHGEVLVGAGDTSFARTRDRIAFLNTLDIDGVAVLAPFFSVLTQAELTDYYRALADFSRRPIFLYDIPQRTRNKIEIPTVLELSKHPNIVGIKCSDDFMLTRQLIGRVDSDFRVIVAQPDLIDVLVRHGVREHLDGVWAIAPGWTVRIAELLRLGDDRGAAQLQAKLSDLRNTIFRHGFYGGLTAVMNARGIPGRFAPRPHRPYTGEQIRSLMEEPVIKELIAAEVKV